MCARSADSEAREQVLGRLVAESLKSSPAIATDACPDAGFVGAYAGHILGESERAQLESHFASCSRCQQILAAFGAALEAAADEPAVPGTAAAAAEQALPVRSRWPHRRWLWWLSPAFGAAAAALLWMALRPAGPEPVQTAANYSAAAEAESRAQSVPNAPVAPPETPPPETNLSAARRPEQTFEERLSKAETAESRTDAREQIVAGFSSPRMDPAPATPPVPAEPQQTALAGPETASAPGTIAPMPALSQRAQTPSPGAAGLAAVANTQAPAPPGPTGAVGSESQVLAASAPVSGMNPSQVILYTFSGPGGSAIWRLGIGGMIQRSTDQGRTWQPQASGVPTDLIAGSASSNEVAWVIGRDGIILRTTDGQTWQRISPPPGVNVEWAAIAAHDESNATVVAEDLRRFSTQDGGRTWILQQ